MNSKSVWTVVVIVAAIVLVTVIAMGSKDPMLDKGPMTGSTMPEHDMAAMADQGGTMRPATATESDGQVVEVRMNSFVEMIDGKPKPQFDPAKITVKKGDHVRIIVTVTKGTHDFHIDEYGIHQATPLNEPTTIEFVADKAGTFEYYCNMPGHRAAGHWGTLTVTE